MDNLAFIIVKNSLDKFQKDLIEEFKKICNPIDLVVCPHVNIYEMPKNLMPENCELEKVNNNNNSKERLMVSAYWYDFPELSNGCSMCLRSKSEEYISIPKSEYEKLTNNNSK